MTRDEVRKKLPGQWVVVEARSAGSVGGRRVVGDLAVLVVRNHAR